MFERSDARVAIDRGDRPMHATFRQRQPGGPGTPIRGTFYPSDTQHGGGWLASALPKLLAILVAMAVVRAVVSSAKHGHGGSAHGAGGRRRSRSSTAISTPEK